MLEACKNEIFDRLAREIYELHRTARKCRQYGEPELATQTYYEIFGVYHAIQALGFDLNELAEYYKANRKRYRDEELQKELN